MEKERKRAPKAPRLNFPVTGEMIARAIPNDSSHCMIADGLKTAMPEARAVSVDLATIRFTDPKTGRRYIYLTPFDAQTALLDFDEGVEPEPFHVKANVVQIVTGGRRQRTDSPTLSPQGDEQARPSGGMRYGRAKLMPNQLGGGTIPVKVGGEPPRLGPLARGKGSNKARSLQTGRIRKFGLRAMGKAKSSS